MASPEQPHTAPTTQSAVATPTEGLAATPITARDPTRLAAVFFCAALLVCLLAYLALAIPGNWFPGAAARYWSANELTLSRGTGEMVGGELVVTAVDASGVALILLNSNLRASDYAAIAWLAVDVPEQADVRMLWRSDYLPGKLNAIPVGVEARTLSPVMLAQDRMWIGRVTGLALAIRGPLAQPIRISGLVAKPMGALGTLGDRAAEWLQFEGWTGTSINVVTGGADVQDLPLPALLAAAVALSGCGLLALRRWRPNGLPAMTAAAAWIGILVAAWLVLDARWTLNLLRQVRVTANTYAGKDLGEKHRAAEDGALYAFIEQARAIMPATPARVFVVSDARYFRERAAYHLFPHNAYTDRAAGSMPPATALRPGDWLVVYQRRGVQYDPAQHRLRWETGETVPADVMLTAAGSALFVIR